MSETGCPHCPCVDGERHWPDCPWWLRWQRLFRVANGFDYAEEYDVSLCCEPRPAKYPTQAYVDASLAAGN